MASINEVVMVLRRQRMNMVSTPEQYKFLYAGLPMRGRDAVAHGRQRWPRC